ncbi:Mth938-like domain-containing protein [Pelagibius marinus]|uniref:Mth938-like domain-containing protein n=1 Tax=Pelagibius marinus TaxID=2762760 RepID=UPI0018728A4F|nr:Mth938-like domain-containing protein [Pelagibius marinus]
MDVTPLIPQGRQIIESYGGGGFTVTGAVYRGSILVLPDWTGAWALGAIGELSIDSLEPVLAATPPIEVLLLGCGPAMAFIEPELRAAARARGVALEPMDTGAACRTYNVLVAEDRRVAAALIAVD